jgi:hypothetical protein
MNVTTKPQHDLAAGILSQARRDLRRFHGAARAIERELYLDAYDWVLSDDYRWPYSFRNVCELLELSPDDVRQEAFRDVSLDAFHYWSRRFGMALRQCHLSLRQIVISDRSHDGAAQPGTLAHTVS